MTETLLPAANRTEKIQAGLIHISSIFAPIWGPAVGWLLVRGKSRFAASHALQAIRDELILKLSLFIALGISTVYSITKFMAAWNSKAPEATFWDVVVQFFSESWLRMLIGILVVLILGVIMTVVSVAEAKRAFDGQWPNSEIKKARKALS
jgi:hypothetical protein